MCIAVLAVTACTAKRESPSVADQYEIIQDATTPALVGTQLKVRVRYDGWIRRDILELRHRIEDGVAQVWLRRSHSGHEGEGALCDRHHLFKLPTEAFLQKSIVLYAPDGRRYVLQ